MGSCLKKALLQPKFLWRSNDSVKFVSRQSKVKSIQSPESVELLNIIRIVAPSNIDRVKHPFVRKDCAFLIITNSEEEILFETATKDDRDKFVFAFKLIVARLAAKIIVGDKDVFQEFFAPFGAGRQNRKKRKNGKRQKYARASSLCGVNEGVGESDSFSLESERSGFASQIVGSVAKESDRKDELWGV